MLEELGAYDEREVRLGYVRRDWYAVTIRQAVSEGVRLTNQPKLSGHFLNLSEGQNSVSVAALPRDRKRA